MMGSRLEKLEKDLHFLTAMQELFLTNSSEFSNSLNNAPASGESEKKTSNVSRQPKKQCNLNLVPDKSRSCKNTNNVAQAEVENQDFKDKVAEFEQEISRIQEQLEIERGKRNELEDAGRRVALQLQKADDELIRQIDTKKGLLIGTLQLKSQLQGYETRINQLELEIGNVKNEKQRLIQDLDLLKHEKQNLKQEIEYKTTEFQRLNDSAQNENVSLKQEVTKLQSSQHDLRRQLQIKEQSANQQGEKLLSQLNHMVVKYVQIERERETLRSDMQKAKIRANAKEAELAQAQETLEKLNSEHKSSKTLHDAVLKSLKSEMKRQNAQTSQQVSSCRSLLSQTKTLLMQLKNEKHEGQGSLAALRSENSRLASNLDENTRRIEGLERDKQLLQERLHLLMSQKTKTINQLQKTNGNLQKSVKTLKADKRVLEKAVTESKEIHEKQIKELEGRQVGTEAESCNVRKELSNVKDNFQIIQKISQDQISTIQKLKSERDEDRKAKTHYETKVGESERNEATLLLKLESEERKMLQLEDEVEYLEAKLSGMEAELKQHSCERFVESTCRNRVQELEKTVRLRYVEWEGTVASIKSERDKALAAARKAANTAEEIKTTCETRILEILSGSKQENSRLQAQNQRIISEKSTKIYEMESEMVKLRQMSEHTQRSLTARIQQLQAALNLCLGGTPYPGIPAAGAGFGAPGQGAPGMTGFGYM